MDINVNTAIVQLLYQNESVNIPGLGGFAGSYKPAALDPVQATALPPSRELRFNENLVADDGLLCEYIAQHHQLSPANASEVIASYVAGIKAALQRKEIVVFPQVGRLYKDYEDKIKFLPDSTNFNTEAFGLPSVPALPVIRAETLVSNTSDTVPPSLSARVSQLFQRHLTLITALAFLVVISGVYLMFFREPQVARTNVVTNVPDDRINISPTDLDETLEGEYDSDLDELLSEEGLEDIDTEAPTVSPNQKAAIITIGVFGDPKNITRLTERIYEAGYAPFTEKKGKLTTVGITVAYEEEQEIGEALRDIQKRFDRRAKVIKK